MSIGNMLDRMLQNKQIAWTSYMGVNETHKCDIKTLIEFKNPSVDDLYSNKFTVRRTTFKLIFNIVDYTTANGNPTPPPSLLDSTLNSMLIYRFSRESNRNTIWDNLSNLSTLIKIVDKRRIDNHGIIEGYIENTV